MKSYLDVLLLYFDIYDKYQMFYTECCIFLTVTEQIGFWSTFYKNVSLDHRLHTYYLVCLTRLSSRWRIPLQILKTRCSKLFRYKAFYTVHLRHSYTPSLARAPDNDLWMYLIYRLSFFWRNAQLTNIKQAWCSSSQALRRFQLWMTFSSIFLCRFVRVLQKLKCSFKKTVICIETLPEQQVPTPTTMSFHFRIALQCIIFSVL